MEQHMIPLLPGDTAPSPKLTRALQDALLYEHSTSNATNPNAPGAPHPPSKPSLFPSSPFPQPGHPARKPPQRKPSGMGVAKHVSNIPSAELVMGSDSWATGEDAVRIVKERGIKRVAYAFRQSLELFNMLGLIGQDDAFVLLSPSMADVDSPFMSVIENEADVLFDMRDYFIFVADARPSESGVWELTESGFLPQRLMDAIYFQGRCFEGTRYAVPSFLSHMAVPTGCKPKMLIPSIFSRSKSRDDVIDMLEAVHFYSQPRADSIISWISVPAHMASEDAKRMADIGESVLDVLLECEERYSGPLNILMPTDTRQEFSERLAQLGEDMGACELLDERLDAMACGEGR